MGNSRDGYVFISYKSETRDKAAEIQEYLEKAGYKCWRAPKSLQENATNNYGDDIFKAIRNSSCVLCVLSDLAFTSDWVKDEIQFAIKNKKQLIPYVVEDISSDTRENDAVYIKIELNKQILNDPQTGDMSVILPFVEKAFREEQERLVRVGEAPVVVLDSSSVDGMPRLGEPVSIVDLTKLSGDDRSHFQKAIDYLKVFKSRSALNELALIKDVSDPIVEYYRTLLAYETTGAVSEDDLDTAVRAAIAAGCPEAMRVYAIMHLDENSYVFAPEQANECLGLLRKAVELGDRDALEVIANAFENGEVCFRDEKKGKVYRTLAHDSGSVDALLHDLDNESLSQQAELLLGRMRAVEGELNKEMLCWLLLRAMQQKDSREASRLCDLVLSCSGKCVNRGDEKKALTYANYCKFILPSQKSPEESFKFLSEAYRLEGSLGGVVEDALADCYEEGFGVEVNMTRSHDLRVLAAEKGSESAKFKLGSEMLMDAEKLDIKRGLKFIEESVALDFPPALWWSGTMMLGGECYFEKDVKRGLERIEKAAEYGDVDALNQLGEFYRDGAEKIGIEIDIQKSVELFKKAVAENSPEGFVNLGLAYLQGEGVLKDPQNAEVLLKKAADEMGFAKAAYELGQAYHNGDIAGAKGKDAVRYWQQAVDADEPDVKAMIALAIACLEGAGTPQNTGKAEQLLLRAAQEFSDSDAEALLGALYYDGSFGSVNHSEAVKWLEQADRQGDTHATFMLGRLYEDEDWDGCDVKKSAEWYLKAASAGDADAMYQIAIDYLEGIGVDKDLSEVGKWLRKAADAGCADAACSLGTRYAEGTFGGKDKAKAIEWWKKAASQGDHVAARNLWSEIENKKEAHGWLKKSAEAGNVDSMLSMGDECYNGVGCIPDEEEAAEWYKKAMENGDGFSALRLATMVADGEYEEDGKDACWFLKEAIRLWEDASEIDNADAMCALGDAYSHDDLPLESPFDRDIEKAVSWYKKAADGGNVRAQFCMGRYLTNELGKDYPSDYDEWVKLLDAQELEDRKIGRNMKKAAAYFELIVNGGKSEYLIGALLRLARINRYFDEVEEAKSYYQKAIDNGSENAPKEFEEYTKSLQDGSE